MIVYRDMTFCRSKGCINDCGRQITKELQRKADAFGLPICSGLFCGDEEATEFPEVASKKFGFHE